MSARETILDAAARVMREKGIARATTKEIAREAGYSEALLYKHFADKQDIYMSVLRERVGGLADPTELAGTGEVHENLVDVTVGLMAFYVASFPMSASIFSDVELLVAWRSGLTEKGGGPRAPLRMVERYVASEIELGRIDAAADSYAIAAMLCGAAFQQAFLACFDGLDAVPDAAAVAERLVASLVIAGANNGSNRSF
ncbi:MAG: ttgW2 [Microbacteriaceae bacterium]|nr:ttgW2 [Microbacteriaceae bacterium]